MSNGRHGQQLCLYGRRRTRTTASVPIPSFTSVRRRTRDLHSVGMPPGTVLLTPISTRIQCQKKRPWQRNDVVRCGLPCIAAFACTDCDADADSPSKTMHKRKSLKLQRRPFLSPTSAIRFHTLAYLRVVISVALELLEGMHGKVAPELRCERMSGALGSRTLRHWCCCRRSNQRRSWGSRPHSCGLIVCAT